MLGAREWGVVMLMKSLWVPLDAMVMPELDPEGSGAWGAAEGEGHPLRAQGGVLNGRERVEGLSAPAEARQAHACGVVF